MIKFLTLETVLKFHDDQIDLYGGSKGIRDLKLLESAVEQPKASFDGNFLYKDVFEMAASYCFGICKNHPFIDGNKRTGFLAMYMFLYVNGWKFEADEKTAYSFIISIATSELNHPQVSSFIRNNCNPRI